MSRNALFNKVKLFQIVFARKPVYFPEKNYDGSWRHFTVRFYENDVDSKHRRATESLISQHNWGKLGASKE